MTRMTKEIDAENISAPPPPKVWIRSENRGGRDLFFAGIFPGILLGLGAALGMSMGNLIFLAAFYCFLVGSPLFLVIGVASVACVTLIQEILCSKHCKDLCACQKELLTILFLCLGRKLDDTRFHSRPFGWCRSSTYG